MYLPKNPIDRFTDGVMESLDNTPSVVPATKTTHTPGPWSVGYSEKKRYAATGHCDWWEASIHVGERGSRGNCLALVCMGGTGATRTDQDSVEANARLIAAAPELLEALEAIIDSARDGRDIPEWLDERLVSAEAAIRKARGEQC